MTKMVDISQKEASFRMAKAKGVLKLKKSTVSAIKEKNQRTLMCLDREGMASGMPLLSRGCSHGHGARVLGVSPRQRLLRGQSRPGAAADVCGGAELRS